MMGGVGMKIWKFGIKDSLLMAEITSNSRADRADDEGFLFCPAMQSIVLLLKQSVVA